MIGRRERWSYAAGDLGFNFVWQSIELYLLFFYIRGLGLAPAVASGIFLAGAAVDFVADPMVGAAADRLAGRVSLRWWVAAGGPLSVAVLALAFAPPLAGPRWEPLVALAAYLALRVTYSIGNIPYAALTARISAAPADHLTLTGTRMRGAAIGGLIAAATYRALTAGGDGPDAFRNGALLLALLALPAFAATVLGVRERVAPPHAAPAGLAETAAATVALVRRSAALRRLLLTIFAAGLAVTVLDKALLFLFDALGARRLGYWAAMIPSAALLVTAPGWTRLAARIGRRRTLVAAAVLKAGAVTLALLVRGVEATLALVAVSIVAGAGLSIMFWAMVPHAIADCERRTAAEPGACAGRVYALGNVARKLAQATAPQVITLALVRPGGNVLWAVAATTVAALAIILGLGPAGEVDRPAWDAR